MRGHRFGRLAVGLVAVSVVAAIGGPASAAERSWAEGLFAERQHDFGPVPRGAVVHHPFVLTNRSGTPITILSLRVSCGCTSGKADVNVVPPGQAAVVEAQMDTRNFVGRKATTLYVSLHNGYEEHEVALNVASTILPDVVLNPGGLDFGATSRGQSPTISLTIDRVGRPDWRVVRMVSASKAIDAKLTETRRDGLNVGYRLDASIKADAPSGPIRDEIQLQTNDPETKSFPITITADVRGDLSATPSVLALAAPNPAEPVKGRVIVRSSKPFKVVGVEGAGDGYAMSVDSAESRPLHVLTVSYKAEAGKPILAGAHALKIVTDLPGEAPALVTATLGGVQ